MNVREFAFKIGLLEWRVNSTGSALRLNENLITYTRRFRVDVVA